MRSILKYLNISIVITIVYLAGCGITVEQTKQKDDSLKVVNREKALEHFVNGSIYDQKGEYANAIIEYQDALRYDRDPAIYYALSRDYSLLRKHALAAQAAREAIELDPQNRTYRESLAEIFINAGEFDNAINSYHEIIKIDSSYFKAWYTLARLYQLKQPLKALEIYNDIIYRFGPNWEVSMQMAELYRLTGKNDEAIKALRNLLDMDPSNTELRKTLAEFYLTAGQNDSALTLYNDIVDLYPTDIEVRAALTHIYLIDQNYTKAAEQFDFVLKGDLISIENQLQFGQIFLTFLQKDSAVAPYAFKLFERIQNQYPDDWRPYWFLGVVASIMKSDSLAIINLKKVTDLNQKNPDGWVYLASTYYDNRNYPLVIEVLQEAKKYVPEEFRVHLILGIAYQRMGMLDSAAVSLEQAVQIDEKNLDALSALALVYDDLKRFEKSDTIYEKALILYPDNHLLLNNYAYSLSVRGLQLERALKMAEEAVRQQPKNPSYLDTIGWIHYMLGNYKKAEKYILQAIEEGEVSSIVLDHLGDVYFKLDNKFKAIDYWQKALEKDKENEILKEKIKKGSL